MFQLTNHEANVINYNATTEKHGNDNVKVGDLKLEVMCRNKLLDAFGQDFRTFLFRTSQTGDQGRLLDESDGLTELNHPRLEPLHLDEKFPGYRLSLESGLGIAEPLVFDEVALSAFTLRAIEGGSVAITFNARCKVSPQTSGALHFQSKETIEVTLTPPAPSAQRDILDDQEEEEREAA